MGKKGKGTKMEEFTIGEFLDTFNKKLNSSKAEYLMKLWFSSLVYLSAVIGIIAIFGASYVFNGEVSYPVPDFPFERLMITGFDVMNGVPSITNPEPENDTYVPGGDATFNVSVVDDDLDNSSVRLYIKSQDAQTWDEYQMECSSLNETTWECEVFGVTLSLDIVGSDTIEYYYFTAGDDSGNTGYLGNTTHPLRFTVDVNPPDINFINPGNGSYVSGNSSKLELTVMDSSSGVDHSTVHYSLDNSSWEDTENSDNYYEAHWDTTAYNDNESLDLYVIASDKINNTMINILNISVDNTLPYIEILGISTNQTVKGTILLEVNVTDVHSGVNPSRVSYSVESVGRSMDCDDQGDVHVCNEYFDSRLVSDGMKTLEFSAYDMAGNRNSSFVDIEVDNRIISSSIDSPSEGDYVRGEVEILGRVKDAEGKVESVDIEISGEDYELKDNMSCDLGWDCKFAWETSGLEDGEYFIFMNVSHIGDTFVNDTVSVILDNTDPRLTIDSPLNLFVNGTITTRVIVRDNYGVVPGTVRYNISEYDERMNCIEYIGGRRYVCGSVFNTSQLSDGQYDITFRGYDLAGNRNSSSRVIVVDNEKDEGGNETTNVTTTTIQISPNITTTVAATTTVSGGGITWIDNITRPIVENPIIGPIVLTFSGSESPLGKAFSSWPFKALAVSMIVFLVVIAIFRNAQIINFFRRGKFEEEKRERRIKWEEDETEDN